MELSLEEAATSLGKSVRQIRYMIQEKRLVARKVAGRWFVSLPPASPQTESTPAAAPAADLTDRERAQARKATRLRTAVEDALELGTAPRRYSLRDLKAFQLALPLYQKALAAVGGEHAATRALRQVLEELARGCHRFDGASKAESYRAARDAASLAVCELLLVPLPGSERLVESIEQELMAALAGLLRRLDRKRGVPRGSRALQ